LFVLNLCYQVHKDGIRHHLEAMDTPSRRAAMEPGSCPQREKMSLRWGNLIMFCVLVWGLAEKALWPPGHM